MVELLAELPAHQHVRVERIIQAVRQEERERCAKIAEDERVDADDTQHPADIAYNDACKDVANKIREG
jgi:hypothetical protein